MKPTSNNSQQFRNNAINLASTHLTRGMVNPNSVSCNLVSNTWNEEFRSSLSETTSFRHVRFFSEMSVVSNSLTMKKPIPLMMHHPITYGNWKEEPLPTQGSEVLYMDETVPYPKDRIRALIFED